MSLARSSKMKGFNIILTLIVLFVCAWTIRVFVPYYKKEQDRPLKRQIGLEADSLLNAIYKFAEEDPEKRFPESLTEVVPVLFSMPTAASLTNNLSNVFNRFIYIQPAPHGSDVIEVHKAILVEKLGHYKYDVGGYIGSVGKITRFYWLGDYQRIIETNGLSISQLRQ